MSSNIIWRFFCKDSQAGDHILGTKRAVKTNTQDRSMLHAGQECFEGLTAQQSASLIADSYTQHQWNILAALLSYNLIGMYSCLTVQGIKDGF